MRPRYINTKNPTPGLCRECPHHYFLTPGVLSCRIYRRPMNPQKVYDCIYFEEAVNGVVLPVCIINEFGKPTGVVA